VLRNSYAFSLADAFVLNLIRGRLHLRFERAVWMCSKPSAAITCVFYVQQNLRPITLNAENIAASCAARRCAAGTRHHAARSATSVFEYSEQKIGWKKKMTSIRHAALHAARRAARACSGCRVSEIGLEFCCTSKTHAVRCTSKLHIENASVIDPLVLLDMVTLPHKCRRLQGHLLEILCTVRYILERQREKLRETRDILG
jgi:hypothetical protein